MDFALGHAFGIERDLRGGAGVSRCRIALTIRRAVMPGDPIIRVCMITVRAMAFPLATNKFASSSKPNAILRCWLFGICFALILPSIAANDANKFPDIATDVFEGMDAPLRFDPAKASDLAAIKGRNTWLLWTAGDEEFWDYAAQKSHGIIDLLKMLDSRKRDTRFRDTGLINEPNFQQATTADEFGVWLDQGRDPQAAAIDSAVYGRSSGVIGFRIFPNPAFDEKGREQWCADRYYNDAAYAANPGLVRPYRVGVTCAACHVAPHPLHPPTDPENPS